MSVVTGTTNHEHGRGLFSGYDGLQTIGLLVRLLLVEGGTEAYRRIARTAAAFYNRPT